MTSKVTWYQDSGDPDSAAAFEQIRQWWEALNGKEVIWQQRMISGTADWSQIDWNSQRFDERFFVKNPTIRGITLYWTKASQSDLEQNSTPHRLELDPEAQQLYVFPLSQQGLVLRVSLVQLEYRTLRLANPTIEHQVSQGNFILTLKDPNQLLAIQVTMNPETLLALKRQIP